MKTALIIGLLIVSVILAIVVMMQEGKGGGLTSNMTSSNETYWGKNKGKSKEAILTKITAVLGFLFIVLSLLISSKWV